MFRIPICILLCSIFATGGSLKENKREYLDLVKKGFEEYKGTIIRPAYLDDALSHLQLPNILRENLFIGDTVLKETTTLDANMTCGLCSVLTNFIVDERRNGMTRTQMKIEVTELCDTLNIESYRVCDGLVELNIDIFLYIIDNNPQLSGTRICDLLFNGICNSTDFEWTIDVPDGQSPVRPKPSHASTFKILQISDVHMDPLYTEGKVKTCDEPLCCQADQDDGDPDQNNSCGYWGEYGNDIPGYMVDEMIRFANTLDFDYVYFTGDIISHRVWSTTIENNTNTIKTLLGKLKGFKVPVYPILGNHEPSPLDVYNFANVSDANFSTQWLFDLVDQEWSEWLPDSAKDTIAKGGFYTVSPRKGFRLVVLNSNVAYKYCWWLLQSDKDPFDQLDWLISILVQAEKNNESVHILSHIPSGSESLISVWGREYNNIINRFANTITGQFNGHTHVDQFLVYFNSSNSDQAVNVAWNGASLVPFNYGNPSFKIYSVDADTFDVIDIDEWTFNLTLANENPDQSPEWYNLYSFRDAYDIPSLQPEDMGNLLIKMATNHSLLADYHLYRYKYSDHAVDSGCSKNCQKKYLCEISTYVSNNKTKCDYLKQLYDENS